MLLEIKLTGSEILGHILDLVSPSEIGEYNHFMGVREEKIKVTCLWEILLKEHGLWLPTEGLNSGSSSY